MEGAQGPSDGPAPELAAEPPLADPPETGGPAALGAATAAEPDVMPTGIFLLFLYHAVVAFVLVVTFFWVGFAGASLFAGLFFGGLATLYGLLAMGILKRWQGTYAALLLFALVGFVLLALAALGFGGRVGGLFALPLQALLVWYLFSDAPQRWFRVEKPAATAEKTDGEPEAPPQITL
jgi:hypothetical protein